MATRAPQASQNRQSGYSGGGAGGNSVDVGHSAITRMAREDTRWFIVAVVILSLVLFLAFPMALLVYVDNEKRLSKAEIRIEQKLKKLEQLEKRLKKEETDE
jgi:hypothetical protein